MLLSDDEDAIKKARFWITQARDPAPWYQHSELGYNYRMSNIVAGIGRGQLLHLDPERRGAWVIYVKTFTFFMLYYYCKHTIINKKEVIIMKKWVVED